MVGAGSKASAAEAEQELLHLWSGVEKDRAAQLERAALRRRCSVDTPYAASHLVCPWTAWYEGSTQGGSWLLLAWV